MRDAQRADLIRRLRYWPAVADPGVYTWSEGYVSALLREAADTLEATDAPVPPSAPSQVVEGEEIRAAAIADAVTALPFPSGGGEHVDDFRRAGLHNAILAALRTHKRPEVPSQLDERDEGRTLADALAEARWLRGEMTKLQEQNRSLAALRTHKRESNAEGWRLVPEEPTAEMIRAGGMVFGYGSGATTYRAMIAAIPAPQDKEINTANGRVKSAELIPWEPGTLGVSIVFQDGINSALKLDYNDLLAEHPKVDTLTGSVGAQPFAPHTKEGK